jgi:hypothetical protein
MTAAQASSNWAQSSIPDNSLSGMADWFGSGQYAPHGFCLFWDPHLVALYWLGNGAIALAYVIIPIMLLYVAWSARNFTAIPKWVLFEFSAFIFCCAVSHIMQIVSIYVGAYWFEAIWLNITGFVSLVTAVTLPFGIALIVRNATRQTIGRILQIPE